MLRQIAADRFPGFAKIRGLVKERIPVIHQMKIDGDISSAGIKIRRSNAADGSPYRQSRNILGYVRPIGGAVFRIPKLTVVRARPDQTFLDLGRGDGEYHFSLKLSQIVTYDSTGRDDATGILRREIRTGYRPTLPRVGRFENDLASVVND